MFRGREDVYAVRWEKGGKSGYAPAAIMDWHALHAAKPEDRKRIYDYVDSLVPMLARMYKKRLAGYQAIGYSVAGASNPVDAGSIDASVDTETGKFRNGEKERL